MAEYRIIYNAFGYIPQRKGWFFWNPLSRDGEMMVADTLGEARSVIDADMKLRSALTGYHEGVLVEFYQPEFVEPPE